MAKGLLRKLSFHITDRWKVAARATAFRSLASSGVGRGGEGIRVKPHYRGTNAGKKKQCRKGGRVGWHRAA